jgi:hypothetical protein
MWVGEEVSHACARLSKGKEASGGVWEHWSDVTVEVHGISRDEINAYLQQYDAALCVFIGCESLLICSNSHGESETRIGTKCRAAAFCIYYHGLTGAPTCFSA